MAADDLCVNRWQALEPTFNRRDALDATAIRSSAAASGESPAGGERRG